MPKGKDEECFLCQKDIKTEDSRRLPCSHRFHSGCIKVVLAMKGKCPVCCRLVPGAKPAWMLGCDTLLSDDDEEENHESKNEPFDDLFDDEY